MAEMKTEEEIGAGEETRKRRTTQKEERFIEETRREVVKMKKKMEEIEKQERKNRIIIKGLEISEENMQDTVRSFLEENFKIAKQIKEIMIVGRERGKAAVVEMMDWKAKQEIMREKNKLRGKTIFIDHDMSKEEKEIQRKIVERAKDEKKKGRKAKIGYKKLYIEGRKFV